MTVTLPIFFPLIFLPLFSLTIYNNIMTTCSIFSLCRIFPSLLRLYEIVPRIWYTQIMVYKNKCITHILSEERGGHHLKVHLTNTFLTLFMPNIVSVLLHSSYTLKYINHKLRATFIALYVRYMARFYWMFYDLNGEILVNFIHQIEHKMVNNVDHFIGNFCFSLPLFISIVKKKTLNISPQCLIIIIIIEHQY